MGDHMCDGWEPGTKAIMIYVNPVWPGLVTQIRGTGCTSYEAKSICLADDARSSCKIRSHHTQRSLALSARKSTRQVPGRVVSSEVGSVLML